MDKIRWYANRLARMSTAEVAYRMRNALHAQAQKHGLLRADHPPTPQVECDTVRWISDTQPNCVAAYCTAADRILSGSLSLFALKNIRLGEIPQWNRDPASGIEAPPVFSKTLDYRDANVVGDIKYLWELNRHLQLVTVAQAYSVSGDTRYLDGLAKQLRSWFEQQCPYLVGPNWTSSLEVAVRLINWTIVWQLISGVKSPAFQGTNGVKLQDSWLTSVYQHCHFIDGHWSRFSSANNHLIGEAAGLFIASVTWPYWKESRRWQEKAREVLLEEALKQNSPDGVNKEQAIAYQQFVLDFLVLAGLAARVTRREFPANYWERVERMLEFIASVMDVAGNVPMIGDADDGCVIRWSQEEEFCPYRSLLATGAVLFGRTDFKARAVEYDDKNRWLLGKSGEEKFKELKGGFIRSPARQAFPEGGYYVLGCDFDTDSEIRLIVDCGPLGYLSIAAHGHADALALNLSVGGREFLIDPGTYAYHTQKRWRDYFRSTTAHNTIRVDNEDQSVSGGNFMWIHHATATCEEWFSDSEVDRVVAMHDGYRRLSDPVLHRRRVTLFKKERRLEIVDTIECRGAHDIERLWHFSEYCHVQTLGNTVEAENAGMKIILTNRSDILTETDVRCGQEQPIRGWVSRGYDRKEPAPTLAWRSRIDGTTVFVSEIQCG